MYSVKTFTKGFINEIEPQSVADGVCTDGLNWMFQGDKVELRRGYRVLGTDVGSGIVTGLRTAKKSDGTEVLFRTRARKIEYYDEITEDFIEIGTDSLPAGADGEMISIESYQSLAGASVYLSSPNSSIYKIMTANPGSLIDMSSDSFRGRIRILHNRIFLWDRYGSNKQRDKTGLYGSKIDKDDYADYTALSEVIETPDDTTVLFTGTLAFKAGGSKRSCFGVVIVARTADGLETFIDDFNGVLTSTAGGTGTINYATGDYSITFHAAPIIDTATFTVDAGTNIITSSSHGLVNGDIVKFTTTTTLPAGLSANTPYYVIEKTDNTFKVSTTSGGTEVDITDTGTGTHTWARTMVAAYQYEDPTSDGIVDFTAPSSPRVSGESFIVRQDDGGGSFIGIGEYDGSYYCIHEVKAWKLTISADDATASNLPYRKFVGAPYWRAIAEAGDGIYYIDTSNETSDGVRVRRLELERLSTSVVPKSISDLIDLSLYRFDTAVLFEFSDYIIVSCRQATSEKNDTVFMYDKELKLWNPPHRLCTSCFDVYGGALHAGDSLTGNVMELYSGIDDDNADIDNFITFNKTNFGLEGLKKANQLIVAGEIQEGQTLQVYASYDGGEFVLIGTISGTGQYVDVGAGVEIGSSIIGKKIIGSGDILTANPYRFDTRISSDKFEYIQLQFKATGIGYVSVTEYGLDDIRRKSLKRPQKYINA